MKWPTRLPEKYVVSVFSPSHVLNRDDWDVAGETKETVTGLGAGERGEARGEERAAQQQGRALRLAWLTSSSDLLLLSSLHLVQVWQQTDNVTQSKPLSSPWYLITQLWLRLLHLHLQHNLTWLSHLVGLIQQPVNVLHLRSKVRSQECQHMPQRKQGSSNLINYWSTKV